jgi:nickel/cobalt transporter (NicO) family protein
MLRVLRRLVLALPAAIAAGAVVPLVASAHPLGNFTVNHATEVVVDGSQLRVHHVVDMAEIPTFQERQRMGDQAQWLDARVAAIANALVVSVDGSAVSLHVADRSMRFQPGQAGLDTLRVEVVFTAIVDSGVHRLTVHDGTDPDRIGWREITAHTAGGAQLDGSDVPSTSPSNLLRTYPQDMLSSPVHVTDATLTFRPGLAATSSASLLGPLAPAAPVRDSLVGLLDASRTSTLVLLLTGFAAMGLGAAHALSPGHGKSVMAGYLVGTRRSARAAVGLGLTITATHTVGVFVLGLITLTATAVVTPESLYPVLTLLSGVVILAVGGVLVLSRIRSFHHARSHTAAHNHAHHSHPHDHLHAGGHSHSRVPGNKGLIAMGIAGGLVPCPSALLVLLAAISLHRVAAGLLLIVAFSAGLALVLVGIGVAIASGTPLLRRLPKVARLRGITSAVRLVPVASALLISAAGLGLTVQALPGVI